MPDQGKVIKGLKCCTADLSIYQKDHFCDMCPYKSNDPEITFCFNKEDLMRDALEALKAQEPRVMTLEEVLAWAETPARKRDPIFFEQKEGKWPNGWICNSVCAKDYYLCCLDKDARCWTSRPTDEQRKAVKWDG